MIFSLQTQTMTKTFVNSLIFCVCLLNVFHCDASSLYILNREGQQYLDESTLGFLQAMQDLENLRDASMENGYVSWPQYGYVQSAEPVAIEETPYYPETLSIGGYNPAAASYALELQEGPKYVNPEELEPVLDLDAVEEKLMNNLEDMSNGEIDDFTDWIVDDGNEMYMFTFLQILDDQLVDKYNEDAREANEILDILSDIENLAEDIEEEEEEEQENLEALETEYYEEDPKRSVGYGDVYPAYFVYEPKRMALAREANLAKRFAFW